jgi:hypothetical protein
MWNRSLPGTLAISLLATMGCSPTDVVPPCAVPSGVSLWLPTGAPPALLRGLKEHIGDFAQPDAQFDATDFVVTRQNRRLIFIWNIGSRWIVATEHGGRGYNDPILAYDLGQGQESATLVEERIAFPETVCSTASSLVGFERKP